MIHHDALPIDARISTYQIRRVLGGGNFGITYFAHDLTLTRDVAIKEYFPTDWAVRGSGGRIEPRSTETQSLFQWGLDGFSKEAQTLAQFHHPNIVPVHQFIPDLNGTAYIVMELIDGETLEHMVARQGLPGVDEFIAIFSRLLDGVEAIHSIDILHRDIKPANIMMRRGVPILVDFGAARSLAQQRREGLSAMGTDGFAPPEQYSRSGKQGSYSDIYALAATAHFLLSGAIPPAPAARMAGDDLPPIRADRAAQFPPQLLIGIERGLAIKAGDRPQTIAEWRQLCGPLKAVDDEPRPPFRIDRRVFAIGAAGTAAAAIAGIGLWRTLRHDPISSSTAPLAIAWQHSLGPMTTGPNSGDPDAFPQVVATKDGALIAAFQIAADGTDRAAAIRASDDGKSIERWTSNEAGTRAHAILPLDDGGALIAGGARDGGTLVARIKPDWRGAAWEKHFGVGSITSMVATPDGGMIAGVEDKNFGNARLISIDAGGTERPGNVVAIDPSADTVQRLVGLPGGGYAVLGLRVDEKAQRATGKTGNSLWVAILDDKLQEVARPRVPGLGTSRGWDITVADTFIYVTGSTDVGNGAESPPLLLMVCLDTKGVLQWSRSDYGRTTSSGRALAIDPDGRLYVGGRIGDPTSPRLAQIGPDGALLWDKTLAAEPGAQWSNGAITALGMKGTGDGYGLLLGWRPGGIPDLYLTRFHG